MEDVKTIFSKQEQRLIPKVNIEMISKEIKDYIFKNKYDYIDYGITSIQMYPSPEDKSTKHLYKFAKSWERIFNYADKKMQDVAADNEEECRKTFPTNLVEEIEKINKKIADEVNNDTSFWESIRNEVIPLYDKAKDYEYWKSRWNKIKFFYDPVSIQVQTSKKIVNKNTGEVIKNEIVSKRNLPPGFVIDII